MRFKPFGATSRSSRAESKRAGQKPYARLEDDIPKLIWKSYLAGAFVVGADGAAFVVSLPPPLPLSLQPVTVPITSPNSTIRVNSLFIVGVTLTNSEKRTSKNFALFLRCFLGYLPTARESRKNEQSNSALPFFKQAVRHASRLLD